MSSKEGKDFLNLIYLIKISVPWLWEWLLPEGGHPV